MSQSRILLTLAFIAAVCLCLSACGQKGDLYRPQAMSTALSVSQIA